MISLTHALTDKRFAPAPGDHRASVLSLKMRSLIMAGLLGIAATASSAPLELKRVFLSSGGVGYFEYEAQADGPADLPLEVPLDQVDDVLKSLVVYDDQGNVGSVTLPGREPLEQVFRDLPFGADALQSAVALLNNLQGAEVEVQGTRKLQGRLLKVTEETIALPNGLGSAIRHRLSVMTADGLQQTVLEESDGIRFADPKLQEQVQGALAAINSYRTRARRTLSIQSKGQGKRTVRAGYVVEAPLWKTSYRLSLARSPDPVSPAQSRLQGWALLENMSGHDWEGVELTLASGNPVTFRQALYQAYYVKRPEVPVEVLGRVLPPADTGTVGTAPPPPAMGAAPMMMMKRAKPREMAQMAAGAIAGRSYEEAPAAMAEPPEEAQREVQGEEAAEQVLFTFPTPVNVKSGHSLMLPIVDRTVPTLRLGLYQPSTQREFPLASVQLVNDTPTSLPPGVITVYEGNGYLGDGRINALPAGDKRLVSFAVDTKVRMQKDEAETRSIAKGSIAKGVLHLTILERETTTYRMKGLQQEDRLLWIEHPRRPDWELVAPDKASMEKTGVELTADQYRIPFVLKKGAEAVLQVVLQHPVQEELALLSMGVDQIAAYAGSTELDQRLRRAFAEMGEMRGQMSRMQRDIDLLQEQRQAVFKDQERLRENLAHVPGGSDLARRYLEKLGRQESTLETINGQIQKAQENLEKLRQKLADYVQNLSL